MEESYVDKSRVTLREISKDAAKSIIVKHHYSHAWTMCRYALGVFYQTDNEHSFFDSNEEKLIGVLVYGTPVGRLSAQSISSELKPDEVDASVQREGDIEKKIPGMGLVKKVKKKGKDDNK